MDLTWLDPERLERRDMAGAVAVLEAARETDAPQLPPDDTTSRLAARLRHGYDGDPPLVAVARLDGRVAGVAEVELPRWDNTHLATITVVVDPLLRRGGIGRQLCEASLARVRADKRTVVTAICLDPGPGMEFLAKLDFAPALVEVIRQQDLRAADWPRLDREYAAAEQLAAAYELVRLPGQVPAELLAGMAELTAAINDAPNDDLEWEDEVFSPERIRAYETAQAGLGRRLYRLVARERASGALAGQTVIAVDAERPWYAAQHDTSVARAHRGHRLGLLLKIGMLRWLREVEPQLHLVVTDNAESNMHMVRVNELLGYRVLARTVEWQRRL